MKKSERLNDMMLFLNDKNVFQLSDIMTNMIFLEVRRFEM